MGCQVLRHFFPWTPLLVGVGVAFPLLVVARLDGYAPQLPWGVVFLPVWVWFLWSVSYAALKARAWSLDNFLHSLLHLAIKVCELACAALLCSKLAGERMATLVALAPLYVSLVFRLSKAWKFPLALKEWRLYDDGHMAREVVLEMFVSLTVFISLAMVPFKVDSQATQVMWWWAFIPIGIVPLVMVVTLLCCMRPLMADFFAPRLWEPECMGLSPRLRRRLLCEVQNAFSEGAAMVFFFTIMSAIAAAMVFLFSIWSYIEPEVLNQPPTEQQAAVDAVLPLIFVPGFILLSVPFFVVTMRKDFDAIDECITRAQRQNDEPDVVEGLAQGEIDLRFPPMPYTEVTDEEGSASFQECAVCLDDFVVGEAVRVLDCAHRYHVKCIDPWISSHNSCPICKSDVSVIQEQPVVEGKVLPISPNATPEEIGAWLYSLCFPIEVLDALKWFNGTSLLQCSAYDLSFRLGKFHGERLYSYVQEADLVLDGEDAPPLPPGAPSQEVRLPLMQDSHIVAVLRDSLSSSLSEESWSSEFL